MIKRKKGISLIVLIITIIVILILVAAILISFNNNNPINKANEAKFKSDLKGFKEQLLTTHSNNEMDNSSYNKNNVNVKLNSYSQMKLYIPDITEEYCKVLFIEKGNLLYIGNDGVNIYTDTLTAFNEYKDGVNVSEYYEENYDKEEQKWANNVGVRSPYGVYGDIDGDGYVTKEDTTYLRSLIVNTSGTDISTDLSNKQFKAMDVDKDGVIDIKDETAIQKFIAGDEVDYVDTFIDN